MASLSYANPNSGTLAYAIGWFNFGPMSLTPPISNIPYSLKLPDNSTLSFKLSTTGSGSFITNTALIPTWSGSAMGNKGYTGINGYCAIYGLGSGTVNITLSEITMVDDKGIPLPSYNLYFADAEATAGGSEGLRFVTDGSPFSQVDIYPPNTPCPAAIGNDTRTVTIGWGVPCTGAAYNSRIFQTTMPRTVTGTIYDVGGGEGFAMGISIQNISLFKDVSNRFVSNDQFQLTLDGLFNLSTITTGISTGVQQESLIYRGSAGDIFTINETMAPGSSSTLDQYSQSISAVNLSGGSIPTGLVLGSTVPLNAGDFLQITIKNTPIPPAITVEKAVDKSVAFLGETLNYTLIINNTSPTGAINTIIVDTIPSATTFIPNSLKINGINSSQAPPLITLNTIPRYSVTTITYDVLIGNTIPDVNPMPNSFILNATYPLLNSLPKIIVSSNTIYTRVLGLPNITGTKIVDKSNAKLNDILTYTIVFTNSKTTLAQNLLFIDTLPQGTTFVQNSLMINNMNFPSLNPNPPGFNITMPSTLGLNELLTISFQAKITSITAPSPFINYGTLSFEYSSGIGSTTSIVNTNPIETIVRYLDLYVKKYVDKRYADYGDIINYTLVLSTFGNLEGQNTTFTDSIPIGTTLVPNSVYVNGTNIPGTSPQSGIPLGLINPNTLTTINFSVKVNSPY